MSVVGIIGAMEEEVAALKEKMVIDEVKHCASLEFYIGKMFDKEVVVVRCGIGKVNAAVCTQIMIDKFNVDMIVNTGVAGAVSNELNIADIVISSDALQHDMDATSFGYKLGEIPRMDVSCFKADEKLIELASKASENKITDHNVFVERIVSGDQFVSNMKVKKRLLENFGGFCTEMEGASIAHVCHLNNVPFVVIRSISDKADNSAETNFAEFTKIAADNSTKIIEGMIEIL
ncbi:5'-methylthioadenosine/adenosylhomocysteine nucleosidase [Vallitalea sp.]|jgi:adenosylhomocysteine nucleosidase|uniref:5'-methylthioadenosine/adenosylhomocysteine nucleosidase n=1 Tax=Vallitalea sp. TaxID=1882829 RepID=UPI0025FE786D|nr:5'-methylthioadenosine/adenosylhomocysteine nucleosidase [Vallitalea sp.]MCT4687933.1 5'-methylthioadenosine/adenosylhomocysteine nucleosidase [Vallitalea sp.]